MAEILLRVHDRANPDDPYKDCKLTKRGDVIHVAPDGWPWGSGELTHAFWRIIKFPGVNPQLLEDLLGPELDTDPQNPSRMLQRRAFFLNLDAAAIPADIRAYLNDDSRKQPFLTITGAKATNFRGLKTARAKLSDPAVIG